VELTVVMPCLNEAETVATCVRKAIGFLAESGISGEVLVADNGSTTAVSGWPPTPAPGWCRSATRVTATR
jgi:Glycosyltransferases involved in cell wall biogenesis